jgi:hypothetical protein
VSDVLIDLGELPPRGASRRFRPGGAALGPHAFRTLLTVLSVALLAGLGGAAAVARPAAPVIVPARLGDAMFVGADRVFLVHQNRLVSTYSLPGGRLMSQTTVPGAGAVLDVTAAGSIILVSFQVDTVGAEATVAVTAGSGVPLWRRPARMLGVSATDGLVLLRENSPDFGGAHWYGIDLATGAQRWALAEPPRGYITETAFSGGFPHRLVIADSSGDLQTRDAITGRLTATGTFEAPSDWERRGIALWPDGDLILIGDHTTTTAYGLADLKPRWTTAVDLYASYVGPDCVEQVCFFSPRSGGMLVVDRATGRHLWASQTWSYADRVGPYLLAGADAESGGSHVLSVVDPVTGRVRGDFGKWQSLGPAAADGTVIGMRQPGDTVYWARLDPARLTTDVLGVADHVSGDCQATDTVLVCRRIDAAVAIWPLTGQ